MGGRNYTVTFAATAVTVAVDVFELDAAAEKPIEIYGLSIGQSSDVGDAAEEILPFVVARGNTTTGTGGTQGVTPRPLNPSDAAAGFTADTLNTTAATAGTAVDLHRGAFNIRTGLEMWLPEGSEWGTSGANLLVVRLAAAPTDSLTMTGTVYVRETG